MIDLRLGDCLEILPTLADASVDLILTDPPYFKVKMGETWDRQWKTPAEYLDWIGRLCVQWRRVLKPNGSLYCFASPRMAARVECKVGEYFEVLNSIVWTKADEPTHALKYGDDRFRQYVQKSERIIFAEQQNSDSMALGESGYAAQCERLHGFVFEPLRAYLDGERRRAGVDFESVRRIVGCAAGSGLPSHWFTRSQWMLPTESNYLKLRDGFNAHGGDYLRREYEDLRQEYETLRRPFAVSADVPYTDVWDFPTVPARPGKHPCEKPLPLLEHMILASSRPGAVVLDTFMGGGSTGEACRNTGRSFIGIESDPRYFRMAERRVSEPSTRPLFADTDTDIAVA